MSTLKRNSERQKTRICGFCGNLGNMSREHFFPQWLNQLGIKSMQGDTNSQVRYTSHEPLVGKDVYFCGPHIKTKQGHVCTKQVRYFCEKCNNGWMSDVQNQEKCRLGPLIKGANLPIRKEFIDNIVTWAVMTTMTAEFTDPSTIVLSQKERENFKNKLEPPDNWLIWIGRYQGKEWNTRYRHHALGCCNFDIARRMKRDNDESFLDYNLQVSIFVIGELLIYVIGGISICKNKFELNNFILGFSIYLGLHPIFPMKFDLKSWHSIPVQSDESMNFLDRQIFDFLDRRNYGL